MTISCEWPRANRARLIGTPGPPVLSTRTSSNCAARPIGAPDAERVLVAACSSASLTTLMVTALKPASAAVLYEHLAVTERGGRAQTRADLDMITTTDQNHRPAALWMRPPCLPTGPARDIPAGNSSRRRNVQRADRSREGRNHYRLRSRLQQPRRDATALVPNRERDRRPGGPAPVHRAGRRRVLHRDQTPVHRFGEPASQQRGCLCDPLAVRGILDPVRQEPQRREPNDWLGERVVATAIRP
jgi:hypothetical protein